MEPLHRQRPGGAALPRRATGRRVPRRRRGAARGRATHVARHWREDAGESLRLLYVAHDPGPVAGGGLVRPGRAQHPRLAAAPDALRAPARHGARCPTSRPSSTDDRVLEILGHWQRGRRPGAGARRRRRRPTRRRSSVRRRRSPRGASPARSTPRGAARPTPRCPRRAVHAARRRPAAVASPRRSPSRGRRRPRPARPRAPAADAGPRARRGALADGRRCRSARRSARWSTPCSSTPTPAPPTSGPSCWPTSPSSGSGGRSTSTPRSSPTRWSRCAPARWARSPATRTLLRHRAARPAARARLRAAARRRRRRGLRRRRRSGSATSRRCCGATCPRATRSAAYADALDGDPGAGRPAAARLPHRLDRRGAAGRGRRPHAATSTVDYKTNWLGDLDAPLTAHDYRPAVLDEAMGHSDYPLQALLYAVVLHRYLRWRLPGYDPADAPRRRALPLPARHVRAGHAAGRRRSRAASSPGGRRSRWSRSCPTCWTASGGAA